jgi:PII-like signaling protein
VRLPEGLAEATKLTIYLGRHQRTPGGRAAFLEVVDLLHRHRVDGATVLLGVDGTAHGVRRRARFVGRNTAVPLMIISVGAGTAIAGALPELGALLERPLLTLDASGCSSATATASPTPNLCPTSTRLAWGSGRS